MEWNDNISSSKICKDGTRKEVNMIKFICPCPNCHKKEICIERNQGYTNPFNHLVACYGGEDSLYEAWKGAQQLSASKGGSLKSYFTVTKVATVHKDLHRWLKFIITTNQPLSAVENKEYRNFAGCNSTFTATRVRETIVEIKKVVEKEVMKDLKKAGHGAIMHDGWTEAGVHYVGLFACYLRNKEKQVCEGEDIIVDVADIVLLSCAPMFKVHVPDKDEDTEDPAARSEMSNEYTTNFTASVHAEHFRKVFQDNYDLNVSEWAKASIADNTNTIRKLAIVLNLPHVGCSNHKLNLDIEDWTKTDVQLGRTIKSVAETMKQAKVSLKNTAVLSELTPLKPVLYNKTRWSGKFDTLSRFIKICEQLIQAALHEDADLVVNSSVVFLNNVKMYHKPMTKLNEITKKLQQRCCLLSKCRTYLDYVVNKHEDGIILDEDHVFHNSTFQPKRIIWDGPLSPNKYFESARCCENTKETSSRYDRG